MFDYLRFVKLNVKQYVKECKPYTTNLTMTKQQRGLKAIQTVKKELSTVKVAQVAAQLKWSRQNIYYHLNESNASNVNPDILLIILAAIKTVKDKQEKTELKKLNSLL